MDNTASLTQENAESLKEAWQELEHTNPGIRIREAAIALKSSEAQLLATTIGPDCVRLAGEWTELLKAFKKLGYVMSLTRNDACILEHKGSFQKVSTFGKKDHQMGLVIGPIETRVFFKSWHVAFAVIQDKKNRILKSIQVFDKAGTAISKIYLQNLSNEKAFYELIEAFRSPDQSPVQEVKAYTEASFSKKVDQQSFLEDWEALQDTHDFFPMLKKHQVDRFQALELAVEKYTYQIQTDAVQQILEEASRTKLPIMIFAGNHGNLQIHQGKVHTIRLLERGHTVKEKWLNVLDPEFNMHLKVDLINTAWVVKKTTKDGIVTAVELFDKDRKLIAQFFGLRKPGIPQHQKWAELVSWLPKLL
ncbi:putative hemin transport protein [Catalinimonas alkaloidigena]|uniref:hemin-degrading factor n=1 Tax=Catalinimonas alkaloidigena TaxID=1075417 RepID=UPI0024070A63|nr:ChuX/HutX family heme-like substrate-binding protein [Catalinimonas alkaloidigena]MDF9796183.1 putative hemin transport protein [Catalinimonas alkaloidigena]